MQEIAETIAKQGELNEKNLLKVSFFGAAAGTIGGLLVAPRSGKRNTPTFNQ